MRQPLSARIAWRYLRAKKSHSAVGTITAVSICGIAVATAAIICVLSVFNGFKSVIAERIDTLTPDVIVTPASGKTIANGDSLAEVIGRMPEVEKAIPSILENALAICEGRETPVTLKGVDMRGYASITNIDSLIIDRVKEAGATPAVTIAVGTSSRLAAYPGSSILLFAPRREGRVNLSNPATSFLRDSVTVEAVYRSNQTEYDENRVIADINVARDLLQYDLEASAVEVKGKPGVSSEQLARVIDSKLNREKLGNGKARYVVKDRLRQQEMNFRMISIEKWVTFLLLFFILLIASFNIISSLSMLVIEKEQSMSTLRALGMSRRSVASVFRWESVFVTITGALGGIAIGLILCLLQQHYGFIRLQGDPQSLVIRAYPVKVIASDILITFIPLIAIGALSAIITGAFAKSRCHDAKRDKK